jgi:hypothetical protein
MNTTIKIPADEVCAVYEAKVLEMEGRGKQLFAYTPSCQGQNWILSIVVDGACGHYPLSTHFACGSERDMTEVARHLNRERLKLPTLTVSTIIAQSMRGPGRRAS